MSWKRPFLPRPTTCLMALLLLSLTVPACSPSPTPPADRPELTGHITFAGSTTVQPLAHELGEAFEEQYPGVTLDIAAGGSVVGIEAVHDGTVDIGMASRALETEEAEDIEQHPIAVDVIAVVVHASNPIQDLALEELRGIYRGEIDNWSTVGGVDQPITVIMRGSNSGTRGAFDEIVLGGEEPQAAGLQTAVTAGDMAAVVAEAPGAIGYVGFGNLEPDIHMVSIGGVMPSEETAQDGSYPLVRPLLLLTGPLTQPVARRFVAFAVSVRGQEIVEQSGWVPAQ